MTILLSGLLGAGGGLIRGLVGVYKAVKAKKKFKTDYFVLMLIVAILAGVLSGIIFSFDYRVSLLAGYAGTDILENGYKLILRKF